MDGVDIRRLQPINIGTYFVETGKERFVKDREYQPPPTSLWRNNLTALSQRYNLYFVASGADVLVYRPSFPYQRLGNKPILSIPPSLANPAANGYLDHPPERHGINHLTVGDLGSEEILLLCTDSGNLAAYHTKQIEQIVRRSNPSFPTASTNYIGVRAFFTHWVHESAWGLAIHKQARMIAVSANKPYHVASEDESAKITVFAFALSPTTDGDEADESTASENGHYGWHRWTPNPRNQSGPDRSLNYQIVLGGNNGHSQNIPNVAFVNSSQDPSGKWLLSTDIGGEMKAWDIWSGNCYRSWDFSDRRYPGLASFFRHRRWQYGWSVAALDPLAFRTADTMEEFCGWRGAPAYLGYLGGRQSYNLTEIVRTKIPGNGYSHSSSNGAQTAADDSESDDRERWPEDEEPELGDGGVSLDNLGLSDPAELSHLVAEGVRHGRGQQGERRRQSHTTRTADSPLTTPSTAPIVNAGDENDAVLRQEAVELLVAGVTAQPDQEDQDDEDEVSASDFDAGSNEESDDDSPLWMEDEEMYFESEPSLTPLSESGHRIPDEQGEMAPVVLRNPDEDEIPTNVAPSGGRRRKLPPDLAKVYQRAEEQCVQRSSDEPPSVPLLHCSATHLRMLHDFSAHTPHVFCAQIFAEDLPVGLGSQFGHFDRINLLQQIPELGVVVIATQVGRCAICSLTRLGQEGDYGLRVDWILPTRKQEEKGHRPLAQLLGLAVGPIQGRFPPRQQRVVAEQMEENLLLRDRNTEGIDTSLDDDVIVLSKHRKSNSQQPGHGGQNSSLRSVSPPIKRKRSPSPTAGSTSGDSLTLETRVWTRAEGAERWRGCENSRRYRIMLTYVDHTILTYEIWREVNELGITSRWETARKNWRNRDPF